ncbi:hypothetical protein EXIGLDRAFT_781061 [Exidia glandulosa HHB12029]|uniref:Uncharacterized protein n=1 Tax=Exidia glandulosa HHB12029 TaxID=1314781 RepID=A0A165BDA4_EXIGL|nr:hypothetical protein EXIGLDRAFT_781061 [Exidia glandulosa HHB12029]
MATVVPSRRPGRIAMTREAVAPKQAIYDLRAPLATALINVVDVTEARFSSLEAALRKESAARREGAEKLKRMLQVYGPSAIGRFYLCGGSTFATAGLLYGAATIRRRSHRHQGVESRHFVLRLVSWLVAVAFVNSAILTYSADHTTIAKLIGSSSPAVRGIMASLAARSTTSINQDEPAQELRLNAWLRIAQYELAVAEDVGEPFPQKLVQILHVFEEVFGCSVSQARTVLGDEFINDPSSILYG